MKKRINQNFSVLALLFLALSIPLGIYSIVNIQSFDKRNKAADILLDVETCQITFPFVNPSSIEVNKKVQAFISANTPGENISEVTILNKDGSYLLKKEYDGSTEKILEKFILNPTEVGDFGILGTLTTDKGTRPCVVEQKKGVIVVNSNTAPTFKSTPILAKPSNIIKVKDAYSYQFEALDAENDNINYAFSFTPDTAWLKPTVIENGTAGKLTIKFAGTPDKPGSYMANIFIHDGYNSHLRAQTWVINVDQDVNDTPKVTIVTPSTDVAIKKGDSIKVSWDTTDLNLITKYELFFATNPGKEADWVEINTNIGPKVGNYIVDTKDIPVGVYQFIVRATDNFNPPAKGVGVSAKVTIGNGVPNSGTDDGVVLQEAQIINISPSDTSNIQNKSSIISATLIPSKNGTVDKQKIKISLDGNDIKEKARISDGSSNNEVTLLFTPEREYALGVHKVEVSFEDSNAKSASKTWTFTVSEDSNTNSDTFKLFGFEIPKRIVYIVAAGLAVLLLALIVPWFLYLAWKGTHEDEVDEYERIYKSSNKIEPESTYEYEETVPVGQKEVTVEETPVQTNEFKGFQSFYTPPATNEITEPVVEPEPIENDYEITPAKSEELKAQPIISYNPPEIVQADITPPPPVIVNNSYNTPAPLVEEDRELIEKNNEEIDNLEAKLKELAMKLETTETPAVEMNPPTENSSVSTTEPVDENEMR